MILILKMDLTTERLCVACNRPLHGRADKRFCNDYCRNNYNNQQKNVDRQNTSIKQINASLLKNRKILASLLTEDKETLRVSRNKLMTLGYQFAFTTHSYTAKNGNTYIYCYDYGYLILDNDWFLVVRDKPRAA